MKRTLGSAVAAIMGGRVLGMLVMIVSTPLIVRMLGAERYGMYATLMAIFGLVMIIVSSGVNTGSRKYLAEDRPTPYWKSNVFTYYLRLAAVLALLASGLFIAATELGIIHQTLGDRFVPYFYLLAVLTLAAQFREYLRRALMGLKLEHISEPLEVAHKILFGIVAVGLVYLGYGVTGVLAGHIISSVFVAGASIVYLTKHLTLSRVVQPLPADLPKAKMLSFNHFTIVYVFLLTTLYHVDVLMLEYFTTSAEVGYYKAALVIVEFLWFVPHAVQSVMIQETSDLWRRGAIDRINSLSSKITRYTLVVTLLFAVGLGVLAPAFVPLYYGPDFARSVQPLLLLLPGTIGFAIARPIMAISLAKGDLRVLITATAAAAGLNFVLNLVLIPVYGMEGAAVATSIGYGSIPVFHIWAAGVMGYQPVQDLRLIRAGIATAVTGIVIWPLAMVIPSPIVSVIVVPPVGFVIFSIMVFLTKAVTLDEVSQITAQLPSPMDQTADRLLRHTKHFLQPD